MAKNTNTKTILIVVGVIVALLAVAYFGGFMKGETNVTNNPDGSVTTGGKGGVQITTICKDQDLKVIPCPGTSGAQAIYQGSPGYFYVQHIIGMTNTGNVNINTATVEITTLTPANAEITRAYGFITGSTKAKAVAKAATATWTTDNINLLLLPTGTYTYKVKITAAATGYTSVSQESAAQLQVEQEAIGFSMNVNLI